jgi:transcriptional regulator with XRE-family HTH domain
MSAKHMVLAEYLRARRKALNPADLGYPQDAARRVVGLRRQEVADRAGISLEYYIRLEQGQNHRVSEQVLASLARALMLDDAGRSYLYRLATPCPNDPLQLPAMDQVSDLVVQLLDQWAGTAAIIFDRNQDILFVNELAAALSPGYSAPGRNLVELLFSATPEGRTSERWRETARSTVAALRFHGEPGDPRVHEIVSALQNDVDFAQMWADHEARPLSCGVAPNFVPGYGWVNLPWQVLDVPGGYFMNVTLCEHGTPAADAVGQLAESLRAASLVD